RAQPQRHHRDRGVEIAEKIGKIVGVLRLEQPVGRAAGLEPDERRKRGLGGQLAANGRKGGRGHAAATAAARPAATLVISPAPRQMIRSPAPMVPERMAAATAAASAAPSATVAA